MYNFKNYNHYNILSEIRKEFVYGAHLIALCGPSFFLVVCILLNQKINIYGLIISYIIPFIVYSYNYQSEINRDSTSDPEKVNYLIKRKKYYHYILIFYLVLTTIILITVNNIGLIFYFIIITAGGVLYTVIFKELTKIIPGFKSFYVALLWAYHGTFFALFFYNISINYIALIITAFIFLKSLINVTYFDLKDIDTDLKEKLKTLPIILGRSNTINILYIINTIALVLLLYSIYSELLPYYSIILSIFYFYTMYYLYKGKKAKRLDLLKYSYIIADAEFILWPVALILSKMLFV